MDANFGMGSYDDVFSARTMSLDSDTSLAGQFMVESSHNKPTETSPMDLEHSPMQWETDNSDEALVFDVVPPPTLPDTFPSPRSASVFRALWQKVWNVQRYRDYRYGHSMSQKAQKERNKWSFQNEEAFWRACACIPPRHRRKEPYPGRSKTLGRNEAIAAYINDTLGLVPNPDPSKKSWPESDETPEELQELTRKNISSHLQVLRPWFQDTDKFVFSWISGDHGEESPSRAIRSPKNLDQRRYSRGPSAYPQTGFSNRVEILSDPRKQSAEPPDGFPVLRSQYDYRETKLIDYFKFCMFLQGCRLRYSDGHACGTDSSCVFERLHTFTQTTVGGSMPDTSVPEKDVWQRFPSLANTDSNRLRGSRLVFAEASLALPSHDYELDNSVDLGIEGRFSTKHMLDPLSLWYCRTTFYDAGEIQAEFEQHLEKINEPAVGGVFSHYLPFASGYWVRKLSNFLHIERRAKSLEIKYGSKSQENEDTVFENEGRPLQQIKFIKDMRERISKGICRLSAKQEILQYPLAQHNNHSSAPLTHLTICWKFRHTQLSEQGITQFRNIFVAGTYTNSSRQQSPDNRLYSSQIKQENEGSTQSPYNFSNHASSIAPSEAAMGSHTFGSYDLVDPPPYQHLVENRPCSSVSTGKTIASTNSSTSFDDLSDHHSGLDGRQASIDNVLKAETPPTIVGPEQQGQNFGLFNSTENLAFDDAKASTLYQSTFQSLANGYGSINYPGINARYPISSIASSSKTFQMCRESFEDGLGTVSHSHVSSPPNHYPLPYSDSFYNGIANDSMMYDSHDVSRLNQQKEFDDRHALTQHFMLE